MSDGCLTPEALHEFDFVYGSHFYASSTDRDSTPQPARVEIDETDFVEIAASYMEIEEGIIFDDPLEFLSALAKARKMARNN